MIPALLIEIPDAQVLADHLANHPKYFPRVIESNLMRLGKRMTYLMRREIKAVNYTGNLMNSVSAEIDLAGGRLEVGPTAKHAPFVYHGTVPHWVPIEPLKKWAAWKLGDEDAAYAVQWSIAKYGTSRWAARKYGTHGENPFLERMVAKGDYRTALANTARRLGMDLGSSITGVSALAPRVQRNQGYGI